MDFTEDTAAETVKRSLAGTEDERLRRILESLVDHLHGLVRDVEPTMAEWRAAIDFLTAVGRTCDDKRQEFILLSDVLGVSMLVETINARRAAEEGRPPADDTGEGRREATDSTVLGPFHVVESPRRAFGDGIDLMGGRNPCVVTGRVLDVAGRPLPGARVDVWQCDENGFYDVQRPDEQPAGNGRGLFTTDDAGRFRFRTVVPSHYPIPTDGPVGALLKACGRHAYRPAHIHLIVEADGHQPLTTHLFVAGSPYIDSDTVFAVKRSLIVEFTPVDDPALAAEYGVANPFRLAATDIVLRPSGQGPPAAHTHPSQRDLNDRDRVGVRTPSLDGRTFRAVADVAGGEVGVETTFDYGERDGRIWAAYRGGSVVHGHLVGTRSGDTIDFRYVQLNTGGETSSGHCVSVISVLPDGRLRLDETWQWESREGSGTSACEEVPSP